MRKWLVLFLIVLLAGALRLYQLDKIPPSLDWDEASLGWNAYSILKTGTDEYGKAWPVSIRSFSDYKPPLYVYTTIPSLAIFGLSEFAVRFPSALVGTLTVLVTFFLVKKLSDDTRLSLLAAFLLAISPWAIQFSRVAFEANLALFFFVLGALFWPNFLWSLVFFILSIYSYHSSRVVVPLFLIGLCWYWRSQLLARWKKVLVGVILGLALLYPLVRNTLNVGSVTARFSDVSIFTRENLEKNLAQIPGLFAKNYLDHFNFDFLFLTGDVNARHHAPDMGQLYLVEFPFLVLGFFFLFRNNPKWRFFILWWFLVAPVASALTTTTPHAVRALLFLPTFQIVTAYGLLRLPKQWLFLAGLFLAGNVFYFLHQYFIHLPVDYARDWQYGYKEAVKKVVALEKKYDRIYFTPQYDQPYIYFLFYGRIAPIVKNNGFFNRGLDKYEFDFKTLDPKGLYVLAPEDKLANFTSFDELKFPNGRPAFFFGTVR